MASHDNRETDDLLSLRPYSDFLMLSKSIHTRHNYQQDLRVFKRFLDESGLKGPQAAQPMDLTRFAAQLAKPGTTPTGLARPAYSTRSLKRILSTLRSFYRHLAAIQAISNDPTAVFHTLSIRTPKRNPRPLRLHERESLLKNLKTDSLDELKSSLVVRMGFECGLRVSEIAGMRVDDLDLSGLSLSVIGKGDKQRTVPMTEALRTLFRRYLGLSQARKPSPYLFPSPRDAHQPINPRYPEEWLRRAAHWAGLENAAGMTVHVLRHTFGTCLAESGANAYEIRDLMGHSSISVSESYVQMASQATRDAHRKAFGSGYRGYALDLAGGIHGALLRLYRKSHTR